MSAGTGHGGNLVHDMTHAAWTGGEHGEQSVSQSGSGEADDDRRPAELTQIAPLVISTGLLYWLPRVVVMGREWLGHVRSSLDSGHHHDKMMVLTTSY